MLTKDSFLSLATLLESNTRNPYARKKNSQAEALREAGERFGRLEYVAAYKLFKPTHEKVVTDLQRLLARNPDFEANKLVKEQQKPLAVAKSTVQKMRAHAQELINQFDDLLKQLEMKPIVRTYLEKGEDVSVVSSPSVNAPETTVNSAAETRVVAKEASPSGVAIAEQRYRKSSYVPPTMGALYVVRDKSRSERVIRVIKVSEDGTQVEVEPMEGGHSSRKSVKLSVESLVRQAEQGWCKLLVPVEHDRNASVAASTSATTVSNADITMRLDIQNFSRCIADIARANIRFDTQLIKDVGDGPFRSGNYELAFLQFEQHGIGFSSAVASSRRAIADGRRVLADKKAELSGKEIQERTAEFVRSEHLIHTAEREFSVILEGLRVYMRAKQDTEKQLT